MMDSSLKFKAKLRTSKNITWKYENDMIAFRLVSRGTFKKYPGYNCIVWAKFNKGEPQFKGNDPVIMYGDLSWAQISIRGPIFVDIKPGSCPNPVNVKSNGVLPVAILGTQEFDAEKIRPGSIRLYLETQSRKEGIRPLRWNWEDVATPKDPSEDCNELGPDGYTDFTLKFKTQELVGKLTEWMGQTPPDGMELTLKVYAKLKDGTPIIGEDVIVILNKKDNGKKGKK
jgi:hypothetical protein